MQHKRTAIMTAFASLLVSGVAQAEWSANASMTNNYIWRGLTQTTNEPAIQGGIDYADESGFYAGTWASNVQYEADDVFSYEHDVYFGYAFESGGISYDIGYLYYNYDDEAEFDFGEVYASIGYGGLSVTGYIFTNTENDLDDVNPEWDFDFGNAYYISGDYAFEVKEGVELALHLGYHEGDFAEAFNGVEGGYFDYGATVSKDGFSFTVTSTSIDDEEPAAGGGLDNDEVKFVVAYAVDFEL